MDLILDLLGSESVIVGIAGLFASAIAYVVGLSNTKVDDDLALKVAEKVKEKLDDK